MWYDYEGAHNRNTDITMSFDAKIAKSLTKTYYDNLRKNSLLNVLKQICVKANAGETCCEPSKL